MGIIALFMALQLFLGRVAGFQEKSLVVGDIVIDIRLKLLILFFGFIAGPLSADNPSLRAELLQASLHGDARTYSRLVKEGVKPTLYDQLSICPRKSVNDVLKKFLGDLVKVCLCPPGSDLRISWGEGMSIRYCVLPHKAKKSIYSGLVLENGLFVGMHTTGGDDFGDLEKPYHTLTSAVFFESPSSFEQKEYRPQPGRVWKCSSWKEKKKECQIQ